MHFVSAVLGNLLLISISLFLSLKFPFACVCIVALGETWERPVSGQTRQTDGRTCQNVTKREEGNVENKGGQEEEKAERAWMVEKVERDGAPDLTTLTHSGLSLLASCALWSIRRGHTRTHIYLSTHAGDENILGLYVCLSVCLNVTAYPCVLKRVWTRPKNPTVCVCFLCSLCAFVFMPLNLYAHLCVYRYIYTSAGECWCSFRSVVFFFCSAAWAGRILVWSVSPCTTPSSSSASSPCLHMCVASANH